MNTTIIINRLCKTSLMYGKYVSTSEAKNEAFRLIKIGKAEKIIDTEETLMYRIRG
ncbi:hypothetical protein [Belliella pelovolcani]|uniref:Uncharacterized protein n=1 Tax=Belliella pelovolcani TaxID=529505 RepID=A0A1N7MRL6_9BACT|nr:hypothetical protein [Belliella pelovolcani]SIS88773.1 hypothetical protein SAMN05421761_10774 [Belliella pelovolcani]